MRPSRCAAYSFFVLGPSAPRRTMTRIVANKLRICRRNSGLAASMLMVEWARALTHFMYAARQFVVQIAPYIAPDGEGGPASGYRLTWVNAAWPVPGIHRWVVCSHHTGSRMEFGRRAAANTAELEGLAVLVVEDEYLIASDFATTLLAHGANVLGPVPDVARGMDVLTRHNPDCVLLDINLKGESAFHFADELVS